MPPEPSTRPAPSLMPSLTLAVTAVVLAFSFASVFEQNTHPPTETTCGTPAHPEVQANALPDHTNHRKQTAPPAGPTYFAGGLYNHQFALAPMVELGLLSIAPGQAMTCQSIGWEHGKLTVIDRSPLLPTSNHPPGIIALSINHIGSDPTPEFATAVQQHLAQFKDAKAVLVFAPLPGPTPREADAFPYDWTFLYTQDNIELIDWYDFGWRYEHSLTRKDNLLNFFRAWQGKYSDNPDAAKPAYQDMATDQLFALFEGSDLEAQACARRELALRAPYAVVPLLAAWTSKNQRLHKSHLYESLLLHRAMGIHADALITDAALSESETVRALAARAIGDLYDQTHDVTGILTKLAEDNAMAVRYEALVACLKNPSRKTAGIAQLVGPYAMDPAMRSLYATAMTNLLTLGKPILANSRANRLRRMPINTLLALERDMLVCKVLLERHDLPDDKIKPTIQQLGEVTGQPALEAFIQTLVQMNPQTLKDRNALLKTLVGWDRRELVEQHNALNAIAGGDGLQLLRSASAGALTQSSSTGTVVSPSPDGIFFKGLAWVTDPEKRSGMAGVLFNAALDPKGIEPLTRRIAALDAVRHLPSSDIKPERIAGTLKLARTTHDIDLRFAAIRALNSLPESVRPAEMHEFALTTLTISAVPGALAYDKTTLSVTAGKPVELTFKNPDNMQHNLVITNPGQGQAIAAAGAALPASTGHIPRSSDVLHHTPLIKPGATHTIRFFAPKKPARYDYVCSFPGHPLSMNGVLEVTAP